MRFMWNTATPHAVAARLDATEMFVARKQKKLACLLCGVTVKQGQSFKKPTGTLGADCGVHVDCIKRVLAQDAAVSNGERLDGIAAQKQQEPQVTHIRTTTLRKESESFAERLELHYLRGFKEAFDILTNKKRD